MSIGRNQASCHESARRPSANLTIDKDITKSSRREWAAVYLNTTSAMCSTKDRRVGICTPLPEERVDTPCGRPIWSFIWIPESTLHRLLRRLAEILDVTCYFLDEMGGRHGGWPEHRGLVDVGGGGLEDLERVPHSSSFFGR